MYQEKSTETGVCRYVYMYVMGNKMLKKENREMRKIKNVSMYVWRKTVPREFYLVHEKIHSIYIFKYY